MIRSFAHFLWATWAIHSHCSLKKKEWENRSFLKKNLQKNVPKNSILVSFLVNCSFFVSKRANEQFAHKTRDSLIGSFIMSDLSKSLTVPHLSWATWAIRSQSLICPERSEQIAHSCSFDLSDLSKWANSQPWTRAIGSQSLFFKEWFWAKEQRAKKRKSERAKKRKSERAKSKRAKERIPNPKIMSH